MSWTVIKLIIATSLFGAILFYSLPLNAETSTDSISDNTVLVESSRNIQIPSSYSCGDLVFCELPNSQNLTIDEKLMLYAQLDLETKTTNQAWFELIYESVRGYYLEKGEIPEQFLPEVMDSSETLQFLYPDAQSREVFISPVSKTWVRLKAEEFSKGDIYIKVLTQCDLCYLALCDKDYYDLFINHIATRKGEIIKADPNPVFYWRMYGENDIIQTTILFNAMLED